MKLVFVICFVAFINCLEVKAQEIKNVPKNGISDTSKISKEIPWFTKSLSMIGEEALNKDTTNNEIYRFIWYRAQNYPISVRIENKKDSCILSWKKFGPNNDFKSIKLIVYNQKCIEKSSWQRFKEGFDKIDFWNLTIGKKYPMMLYDGGSFFLEGKINNRYHVIYRLDSMHSDDSVRGVLYFLIILTDLNANEAEKYLK